ncbi:MAG: RES family NAD+ phosphorylase [Gammaproteobacteria bacterium]|nr:RES family NAD+ phosphorylase [Gammaproteobacteria bacterium]
MAERIDDVFEQHYTRTSDHPNSWQQTLLSDRELEYDWERDGEPVVYAIANAADMPEEAAKDIQVILHDQYADFDRMKMGEETEYCSESYYEEKGTSDQAWQEEWNEFERSLKTEARFFSRTAADHLRSVFRGIDAMSATDGRPLVIDAGPETPLTAIFRARTFQSDDLLEDALCTPEQQLGSPPASLAVDGRMNPRGISVFYGANESRVAIAEVRPPVGSQVAVASFEIIRPLRLLDLTAVSAVNEGGSVFDSELAGRLERAMFLRSLSQRITQPVMPDDEASEYLSTQAIADFLATESETPIDGIVFPSVQVADDALNVVLFHKAARVERIKMPDGTETEATTGEMHEEGWERRYTVIERVPSASVSDDEQAEHRGQFNVALLPAVSCKQPDPDCREPALRIDIESIKVHVVDQVKFKTTEHDVSRHRWEDRNRDLQFTGQAASIAEFVDDL